LLSAARGNRLRKNLIVSFKNRCLASVNSSEAGFEEAILFALWQLKESRPRSYTEPRKQSKT